MKHLEPRRKPRPFLIAATAIVAAFIVATISLLVAPPTTIAPQPPAELTEPLRDTETTVPSAMPESSREILATEGDVTSQDADSTSAETHITETYPGEVVTTVSVGTEAPEVGDVIAGATVTEVESIGGDDADTIYKLVIDDSTKTDSAIAELEAADGIEAQPNFVYRLLDAPTSEEVDETSLDVSDDNLDEGEATESDVSPLRITNDAYASKQYSYKPTPTNNTDESYYGGSKTDVGAGVNNAWNLYRTNKEVTIAVLDTGCWAYNGKVAHPDLVDNVDAKRMIDVYASYPKPGDMRDNHGHGTHVCGIVAATADNAMGVAGASYNANVLPIKVFNDEGGVNAGASTSDIVEAYQYLDYLVGHKEYNGKKVSDDLKLDNLRVINMSLGYYPSKDPGSDGDDALREQIEHLKNDHGVLTVAAGGNGDGNNRPYTQASYPSDYDAVFSVTSLDRYGDDSVWSDYNGHKDISAPGEDIYSTYPGGGYVSMSGTSMASPLVAGISGLLFAADPSLSPDDVTTILRGTGTVIRMTQNRGPRMFGENKTGAVAMVNAEEALRYVLVKKLGYTNFIEPGDVELAESGPFNYNGIEIKPRVVVNHDGQELTLGTDYEITYMQNLRPGTASIMVKSINGWHGFVNVDFEIQIREEDKIPISSVEISGLDETFTFNGGNAIEPNLVLTLTGNQLFIDETLKPGIDYTVSYSNNVNAGEATAIIRGIGIFKGEVTKNFTIAKANCNIIVDESIAKQYTRVGDGEQAFKIHGPSDASMVYKVTSTDSGIVDARIGHEYQNLTKNYYNTIIITPKGKGEATLTLSGDSDNYNKAADVEIRVHVAGEGEGLYDGTKSIKDAALKVDPAQPYAGTYVRPNVTVMLDGMVLTKDKDYTLEYMGHDHAGTASVRAKGTYNVNSGKNTGYTDQTEYVDFTIPRGVAQLNLPFTTYDFGSNKSALSITPTTNGMMLAGATSDKESVATATYNSWTGAVEITPHNDGLATITISTMDTSDYKATSKKINVSVGSSFHPSEPIQEETKPDPVVVPELPDESATIDDLPDHETMLVEAEPRTYQLSVNGGGLKQQVGNTAPAVAEATVDSTRLTVTPKAKGTTTITVECVGDNEHRDTTASMVLTVRGDKENAVIHGLPTEATLYVGQIMSYDLYAEGGSISGTVQNTNPRVATASFDGDVLTVTPLASGSAQLTLTCDADDMHETCTTTLYLTVKEKTNAIIDGLPPQNTLTLAAGASQSYDLTVTGGSLRADLENSNPSVASAKLSGNRLTITAQEVESQAQSQITLHCDGDATHNDVDAVLTVVVDPRPSSGETDNPGSGGTTTPDPPSGDDPGSTTPDQPSGGGGGGSYGGGAGGGGGAQPAPGGDQQPSDEPTAPELTNDRKPVDELASKGADELNKADDALTVVPSTTADDAVTWTVTLKETAQEKPAAEVGSEVVGGFIRSFTSGDSYKTVRSISTVTGADPKDEVTIRVRRGMTVSDEQIARFAEKLGISTAQLHDIGALAVGADATGEDLVDKSCQILVTGTNGKSITYTLVFKAASGSSKPAPTDPEPEPVGAVKIYRLYDEKSGEHLFTKDPNEYRVLHENFGWKQEGVAWTAPASGTPVHRLYNSETGEHFYTASDNERNVLVTKYRWTDEDVAWYSDDAHGKGVYRLFHPEKPGKASHHYTVQPNEYRALPAYGWQQEDVAWWALAD